MKFTSVAVTLVAIVLVCVAEETHNYHDKRDVSDKLEGNLEKRSAEQDTHILGTGWGKRSADQDTHILGTGWGKRSASED